MSTFSAYLITPPAGSGFAREFDTVGARAASRARELGGIAEAIELPATKAGLIPFLNSLEQEHAAALQRALESSAEAPIDASSSSPPAPIDAENDDDDAVKFDARVLEAQVTAFAEAGDRGLDQLEALQELTGVGAAFSRGVHLLTIVAAGDHQLARILRRVNQGRRK